MMSLTDQFLPGDHQLVRDMFRRDDTNTRCEDRELGRYMEQLRGTLNYGIVNGVGKKWQEQSRFMTTALREFGFGKSGVEEVISEEVRSFKSYLETQCDQTIYFHVKHCPFGIVAVNAPSCHLLPLEYLQHCHP